MRGMERLRTWVEANGLTQQALADRLGVERTTVSQWLSGYYAPSRKALEKMSSLTGLSLDELLDQPKRSVERKRKRTNA